MKFSLEKKNSIRTYILEKVAQKTEALSRYVSEELGISQNTVHNYIMELQDENIIAKTKRGCYELVTHRYEYNLKRSLGELDNDTYVYENFVQPVVEKFERNVQYIWSYGVSEMNNNVIAHSLAENLKVIIEQNYIFTRVSLIDDGIGIFRKIKDHFSLPSLDEAICELFKGKLTTDAENHSGEGIFFTSKMMDEFFIYSDGKIFTADKYDNDCISDKDGMKVGTYISMTLSNNTKKEVAEIFDRYSNDDSAFTKTKVPLRNIFDKAPVSRSQAKRLCNRFDQFDEVEIDFDGIEWMGQGFAHQVFVVYAKSQPQIKLKPTNMSDAVKNMYNHVVASLK